MQTTDAVSVKQTTPSNFKYQPTACYHQDGPIVKPVNTRKSHKFSYRNDYIFLQCSRYCFKTAAIAFSFVAVNGFLYISRRKLRWKFEIVSCAIKTHLVYVITEAGAGYASICIIHASNSVNFLLMRARRLQEL